MENRKNQFRKVAAEEAAKCIVRRTQLGCVTMSHAYPIILQDVAHHTQFSDCQII